MKTKAELLSSVKYDLRHIKTTVDGGLCTPDEWATVMAALASGDVVRIDESFYDYFLNVLPPLTMFRGGFVFCEGIDAPRYFLHLGQEGYVAYEDHAKLVDSSAYTYDDWHGPKELKPTL